jgi:hypothetical protein
MINKLTKKGLTEALVGQLVKDVNDGDLTVLTELVDSLAKKTKLAFLPETLTQSEIDALLQLAKTDRSLKVLK